MRVKPYFEGKPHNNYTRSNARKKIQVVIEKIMSEKELIYRLSLIRDTHE